MIGCLQTCVCKQPIIALYFESETVLKFYNLKAWTAGQMFIMYQSGWCCVSVGHLHLWKHVFSTSFIFVDCGSLEEPLLGFVNVKETTFNSTATYTCSAGYEILGSSNRTCLGNGSWSQVAPTCVPVGKQWKVLKFERISSKVVENLICLEKYWKITCTPQKALIFYNFLYDCKC